MMVSIRRLSFDGRHETAANFLSQDKPWDTQSVRTFQQTDDARRARTQNFPIL